MAFPNQRPQVPRHPNLPGRNAAVYVEAFPVPAHLPQSASVHNPVEIGAWLREVARTTPQAVEAALNRVAALLETYAKANASGRPGPRVVTGNYRRSIRADRRVSRSGRRLSIRVGSDAPQAHRLEYGFYGRDVLGRSYNQPPFPHFGPAAARVEGYFRAEMEQIGARVTG